MKEFENNREQEPLFYVSCEYYARDLDDEVVMKFGADLFGDPHIERTEIRDGQVEKTTMRAYCYSEPAILTGLLHHAAAGKSEAERQDLHAAILAERAATSVRKYDLSNSLSSFNDSYGLRYKLEQHPTLSTGDVLCAVSLYGQGEYYLQLVHQPGGVVFQEKSPFYGELDDDADEDDMPPIIGDEIKPLFTVPDSELVQFAACFSKSDRGRVDPDSLRELLDGLLPADQV